MRLYLIFLLFAILPILFIVTSSDAARIRRVVNGIESKPGQWPFMAALYYRRNGDLYRFFCGAMVWDNQTILTAAHCVDGKAPNKTAVYLGHVNRTILNEDYLFNVKQIIVHQQFDSDVRSFSIKDMNDIALLRLAKPINFIATIGKIAPVPRLVVSRHINPKRCITLGWGATVKVLGWGETERARESKHLREADVFLESCYPSCTKNPGTIGAADLVANKGVCIGDSGGPLLCELRFYPQSYTLLGIASTSLSWCRSGFISEFPSYTYVPHYLEWIEQMIEDNWV